MSSKPRRAVDHYFSKEPSCDDRFGIVKATLRGRNFQFLTSSSVFSKKKVDLGTHVLIDAMALPPVGSVLDIGCGYGAVGITAAATNPKLHVMMTDVNMRAATTFSFNDFISNGGILVGGGLVLWLGQNWPDLVVAVGIAVIAFKGGIEILHDAHHEAKH